LNIKDFENVLILQGGGSLGAFGCGVFKEFANQDIKFDILAGTSIGGINAAIIAGSKQDNPEKALEQFWLEVGENTTDTYPSTSTLHLLAKYNPFLIHSSYKQYDHLKSMNSFYSSACFGNKGIFLFRWNIENLQTDPEYFQPEKWTYLYDITLLEKTLEKYIDYKKLGPDGKSNGRLIITAVKVLTSEPLTFDSFKIQITPKHILATCAYPLYLLPWIELERGLYCWDGGILSNTPVREVIEASPVKNKNLFIVENYPRKIKELPSNIYDVLHRTRDMIFSDKTTHNIKMSKIITRYLRFIDQLYKIIEKNKEKYKLDEEEFQQITSKYRKFKVERGAEIQNIYYIDREEKAPHIYENIDFSLKTIKELIKHGEKKTKQVLKDKNLR